VVRPCRHRPPLGLDAAAARLDPAPPERSGWRRQRQRSRALACASGFDARAAVRIAGTALCPSRGGRGNLGAVGRLPARGRHLAAVAHKPRPAAPGARRHADAGAIPRRSAGGGRRQGRLTMTPINIIRAINDNKVFGRHFKAESWNAWRVFLAALFGLPLTHDQLLLFQQFTGRTTAPTSPLHEAWLVVGRRGGKSFVLAVIATFLACFKDWRPYLGPGEVGTIMIIAQDRKQARAIKRFISGLLRETPMLAPMLEEETVESIRLRNRIALEIHTASFRSTRGYTIVAAFLDQVSGCS